MKTIQLFILTATIVLFTQCKSNNKTPDTSGIALTIDSMAEYQKSAPDFLLLSPNEIMEEIFTEKITVNSAWTNPLSNEQKYIDTKSQAINLGVYIADFAYLNLYGNKTNTLEHFKTIRLLAQKINIAGYFDENFYRRIEMNLTNNDSIINISKEMYYNMNDILEQTNRQNLFAMVSCGALIETFYLTSVQVTNYEKYHRITQRIFDQDKIFNNFYNFTTEYKSDPNVNNVLEQLNILKRIFDEQSAIKQESNKVKKDANGHLVFGGSSNKKTITEKEFNYFRENVKKIRNDFVSFK